MKRQSDVESTRVELRVYAPNGYSRLNAGKRVDSWSYDLIVNGEKRATEHGFYVPTDAKVAGFLKVAEVLNVEALVKEVPK